MKKRGKKTHHSDGVLYLCPSEAVRGVEQDFSLSLTVWSVCPDTYLVSGSHSVPLWQIAALREALVVNCPEWKYWFSCLSLLAVARWTVAEMTPLALGPFSLISTKFPMKTSYTAAWFYTCQGICWKSIQAGQRPFILAPLNVNFFPTLHINNWPWHCRTPILVVFIFSHEYKFLD